MTLFVYVNAVEMANRLRLEDGIQSVTSNADGTYGASGLKFDDPNGDLTIGRFQNVIINETDCTPNRVFTGYVIEARPSRGPYKQGVGRVWNVDVGDLNVLSHLQAFHTSDAKRPQETGSARRDWLLGTTQARYFHDAGQADDFTGLFDEADYRGQYPDDVLNDISGPIGRIFFLYWTNTSTQVGLFWAGATDGLSTSTLSISNVLADVNNTTVFGPAPDAELTIDMSEVYDEVILNWAGGQVFASDYDGRMPYSEHRTGVFDVPRVGRLATAQAEAQLLLARYSGDAESITCTVQLPSDKVNLIDAGMLVPVKFSHLPDYTTYTNLRVAQRTVNLAPGTNQLYDVTLKLNLRGVTSPGGGTGGFPHQGGGTPSTPESNDNQQGVHDGTITAPANDDNLVLFVTSRTSTGVLGTPTGWTKETDIQSTDTLFGPATKYAAIYSRVSDGTDGTSPYVPNAGESFVIWNFGPDVTLGFGAAVNDQHTGVLNCGSVSPPGPAIVYGCVIETAADANTFATTPGSEVTEVADFENNSGNMPWLWVGSKTLTAAGTTAVTGTVACSDAARNFWGAGSFYAASTSSSDPPRPGQWVYGETPTPAPGGGVTTFTTAFPFADGSLRVFVDHVEQTAAITTYDGATGSFTLAFDPRSWETILVDYQGR